MTHDWLVIRQAISRPSAEDLASILSGWSDSTHGALSRRLANAIRVAVTSGLIPDEARLPAERALATALGVGRSTVTAALEELRGEGLLRSRQGSGTVVRGTRHLVASSRIGEHFAGLPGVDLAAGNPPDPSHWPPMKVDVSDLISDGGGPGVHPLGLEALREALAMTYIREGLLTDTSQVHVTSGAHQAMALIMGAYINPGDPVAVEETSYPGIFDVIDNLRARAEPLATDAAGVVPESLEQVLSVHHPKVLYLQNGPHNPTGRVPAVGRLRELANILDRHDTVVVEDSTLAELAFDGRVRPELANLCRRAVVASVGSLSKVAWAGLRIGWLRAPAPLIEQTMHLRLATDLGPAVPSQLFAIQLLPHLEEMARRRREAIAATVSQALECLRADFPDWQVDDPAGGSVLWARLPVTDSGSFVQIARRHGVHIAPGSVARAARAPDPHVRICVDRPWPLVETGLRRLSLAWRDAQRRAEPVLG
jgi:DNA-binding transcriptional MocR family regulator